MNDPDGDDLRDLLDSSFGDGPAPAAAADRLVPARRALRRRRLVSGGGLVAGVAAAVTAVALLGGPGGTTAADPADPAAGPTTGPTTVATPVPAELSDCTVASTAPKEWPAPETAPDLGDQGLGYDPDTGQLMVPAAPGPDDPARAETETPTEAEPGFVDCDAAATPAPSPELVVPDSEPSTTGPAVEDQPVEDQPTGRPGDALVRFAGASGERLVARGDARVVAQSGDVTLPDNFAAATDRTAVARLDVDGEVVYVLARQVGPQSDYIAVTDTAGRWPTIKAFLRYAEKQYAAEVGLM
ncbi:hypothetical protein [Nocardioides sp.]|uniref:hypothetical protein n=1 Tax=Nocardioides sp. TaxID=35761 RepID=UPI002720ABD7|nr:hypothetical protein [Nocardioides sp.]MDO9458036.1 hypothetical protein [Nocardioides sp.]